MCAPSKQRSAFLNYAKYMREHIATGRLDEIL